MPVFTNQLSSLRDLTPEESVSVIANHIRSIQEQLEYRLLNLDSSNISEINADETNILSGGKPINNVIQDQAGAMSILSQAVNSLGVTVASNSGSIADLRVTADGLTSTVTNQGQSISSLQQTSTSLSSSIQTLDGQFSTLQQTVTGMYLSVSNGSSSSTISLMQNGVAISSKTVQITGMVTFSDLSGKGGSTINGSNITTGSINANLITTGTLSSNYIKLYDSMAVYSGSSIAGYIGYTTSANDGTSGVHLKKGLGEVVATANGSKLTYNGSTCQVSAHSGGVGMTSNGTAYFVGQSSFYTTGGSTLGLANNLWGQIYSTNATVSTSDARMKHSIEDLPEKYLDLFDGLRPVRFKLNDGTSDRYHVGFISQEVEAVMGRVGVESQEFGGFVKDQDPETGEYLYFLRYEEFIGVMAAKMQEMDRRLTQLEVSA